MQQSIIVTGGIRGICEAISVRMCRDGFCVHAFYRDPKRDTDARELTERFPRHLWVSRHDVGDPEEVADFFAILSPEVEVVALVNNARTYGSDPDDIWRTNVLGPLHMTSAFADYRRGRTGFGAVVNIGSTSARDGPTGSALYAASKAAMHRVAGVEAVTHARLLRINTVVCGPVETDMLRQTPAGLETYVRETPSGRLTTPDEVAEVVSWLIRTRELNLVGAEIVLDGGRSCNYRVSP